MKFSKKVFEVKNPFVKMFVREILRKSKTIEQVPDIGNLREVVSVEVDRIEREYEEKHKKAVATPKEVVTEVPKEVVVATTPVSEQPKVEEVPKEVVTPTPTVSETPKETTETERKEEHAE